MRIIQILESILDLMHTEISSPKYEFTIFFEFTLEIIAFDISEKRYVNFTRVLRVRDFFLLKRKVKQNEAASELINLRLNVRG